MTTVTTITSPQNTLRIRPLMQADYPQWFELWQGYLTFYETTLSDEISHATWAKINDSTVPIYGFGAFNIVDNNKDNIEQDKLVGMTHIVLHPNTWDTSDCCYLEDLYVDSTARGQGAGRALIEHVYEFANTKNCNRVYWTTQENNTTARKLYDTLADKTDMVQYRHNL